jgi:hypothetical protein
MYLLVVAVDATESFDSYSHSNRSDVFVEVMLPLKSLTPSLNRNYIILILQGSLINHLIISGVDPESGYAVQELLYGVSLLGTAQHK